MAAPILDNAQHLFDELVSLQTEKAAAESGSAILGHPAPDPRHNSVVGAEVSRSINQERQSNLLAGRLG
jgi:hypothetical protein